MISKTEKTMLDANGNTIFDNVHKDLKTDSPALEHIKKKVKFVQSGLYVFVNNGFFDLVPINTVAFVVGHALIGYGLASNWSYVQTYESAKTLLWSIALLVLSGLGLVCGAHRLWTHRSFKASLPLQIFLCIGQCVVGQNCIYIWARDHRVHHKYSDTDGDPHNINRGVFFAHVGWLLKKRHPYSLIGGSKLNFDDLKNDPLVDFQMRHYYWIYGVFAFAIPVLVPVYFWNESLVRSFFICYVLRQGIVLHDTWFVNSAAHLLGDRPYDPKIVPVENEFVSFFALGEGYHNFHHAFPFDYRVADFGRFNIGRIFLDWMAKWGHAYDLKVATKEMINGKQIRRGIPTTE